jgi:hypothetical protein
MKLPFRQFCFLTFLLVLASCAGEPTPTPDLVATQIAVDKAANATITPEAPTPSPASEPAALASPTASATPTPAGTPVPRFAEGDQTELCDLTGRVDIWAMGDGCNLQNLEGRNDSGKAARIGSDRCFNAEYGTWFYFVYFGRNPAGWVDEQKLVALPNHCPPTPTSSVRSPFEKCVESGRGVRYVVSGTLVNRVSLTWQNDTGGTNQGESTLPVCKAFTGFQRGDFLYISAQIAAPTSGAGSITCRIYDGASVISEAQAHGFPSIATCSGFAR